VRRAPREVAEECTREEEVCPSTRLFIRALEGAAMGKAGSVSTRSDSAALPEEARDVL
jgi:hypothetical protein